MTKGRSPIARLKAYLLARWQAEDYPGATPRFQLPLLGKDVAIFILLPVFAIVIFKTIEGSTTGRKRSPKQQQSAGVDRPDSSQSQIVDFRSPGAGSLTGGFAKRAPGSLVKLKLLNVVETYSTAPVHARIIDSGLGQSLMGGILIGDAISDGNFERITISFRFARHPSRDGVALPISARALGLDGTLGLIARKKEGVLTRSVIGSAHSTGQNIPNNDGADMRQVLFKALTAGLIQEFGSATQVEKNRAQVLTLQPSMEFYAELTDFFPGSSK